MRVTTIVIDGLNEEDFRRSVQNRLREGRVSPAIARLRALLAPYTGPNGLLPERFIKVEPEDLVFAGWDSLGTAIGRHDRPGRPVTALSIAFGWAGEEVPVPDAEGRLQPHIETAYYTDDAFPFSQSSRDDLLEGYSSEGCTWGGDCEAADTALAVHGIDDLYGALAALEAELLSSDEPDETGLLAGSIGACLLSALLIEAVKGQVARHGLPRPLCVTAGSNGVYPYFDAPVAGMPADVLKANEGEEDTVPAGQGVPVPRYSSLLVTSIPRARKRAVLVLNENEDEMAQRIASLRQLHHPEDAGPAPDPLPDQQFAPDNHADGQFESDCEPEFHPDTGGLLLAKKPVKTGSEIRDMLAPRDHDLQQRLQSLLATAAPRPVEAGSMAVPEPSIEWEAAPSWTLEPAGLPAQQDPAPAEAAPEAAFEPGFAEIDLPVSRWSRLKGLLGKLLRRR
ncbi:MAG: hypothetical protein ACKOOL_03795 [Novosphingobium sp.]